MAKNNVFFDIVSMKKASTSLEVSEESNESKAKSFLAEMKKTLSQVNFNQVVHALQSYKTSDDLQGLLAATAFLSEDGSTHSLLRGWWAAPRLACLIRRPGEEPKQHCNVTKTLEAAAAELDLLTQEEFMEVFLLQWHQT